MFPSHDRWVKETDESPQAHVDISEILTRSDVIDNATSTDTDLPGSANQVKQLNDKTVNNTKSGSPLVVTTNPVLDVLSIIDDLTSGGSQVPGSAEQLKVLKGLVDALASKTPGEGLDNVGASNQLKVAYSPFDLYVDGS